MPASPLLSLVAVLVAMLIARLAVRRELPAIQRALDSDWAPLVAGMCTAAVTWFAWGTLRALPVVHDETAYLLQAELFAKLRWTGAARPLPQFFEQLYVLVEPVLASKYPPGTSLLLAPGVLLGLPGLPVIVMNLFTGALVFAIARRIAGAYVALLTWLIWLSCFPVIYWRIMYLSEVPTGLAWLATWWGFLRWKDGAGRGGLIVAAAAVGVAMISRPLTGVALGLVAIAVAIRIAHRRGRWRDLTPAIAVGTLVVSILPLWNWRTTGHVALSPLALYTQTYVPFDKPGFGVEPNARPSSRLPSDQAITSTSFFLEHARHTAASLPKTAWQRLSRIALDAWYGWRGGLALFALIGVFVLPSAAWVGAAAFALQFVLYLSYAHPSFWSVYYLEGTPLLAFVSAVGVAHVVRWAARRASAPGSEPARGYALASIALAVAAVMPVVTTAREVRATSESDHAYHNAFALRLQALPDPRAVVFVRYGPQHNDGLSLIHNPVDLNTASRWTVYDRGAENDDLLRLVPDRTAYLFDEASGALTRIQRTAQGLRKPSIAQGHTPISRASRR